jgi:hypothetical protein
MSIMFLYFSDGAEAVGAALAGAPAAVAPAGADGFGDFVGRFPAVRRHNTPDCQRQMWEARAARLPPRTAASHARARHAGHGTPACPWGPHQGRLARARSKAGAEAKRAPGRARAGDAAVGAERRRAAQVWENCPVGGADAAKEENAVVCCSMLGGLTASGCTCAVMGFAEPDLLAFIAHWSGHCNSVPMWDIYRLACHGTGARRRASM